MLAIELKVFADCIITCNFKETIWLFWCTCVFLLSTIQSKSEIYKNLLINCLEIDWSIIKVAEEKGLF